MTDLRAQDTTAASEDGLTQCVPLAEHFNASTTDEDLWPPDLVPTIASLPSGRQELWGLPFELEEAGPGQANIVLVGGRSGTASVEIPVDGEATYVALCSPTSVTESLRLAVDMCPVHFHSATHTNRPSST